MSSSSDSVVNRRDEKRDLHNEDDIELREVPLGIPLSKQSTRQSTLASSHGTKKTIDPKTKHYYETVGFACILSVMFSMGWNDGTQGPLLPTIQAFYNLNFTIVSMIFVVYCIGFLAGSALNIYLSQKLTFGWLVVIGATFQTLAYTLASPAPPFPVFCLGYFFMGLGISLQIAHTISYVVALSNPTLKMGIFQMTYGIGALISPLSATHFATQPRWSFHYLVSLGFTVLNIILASVIFRFKHVKDMLGSGGNDSEVADSSENHYSRIMKMKIVHVFAVFLFAYVGTEVTIGGWIVTFVEQKRGGGPSSGYLTTGFFAGLALGRIIFIWLTRMVGDRRSIWMYLFLAMGMEITIWVIPSLIENAVAVSLVGLFLGPIYPIVMNMCGRLIPPSVRSGALGWIAGFAQSGSAVLPFITGAMASKLGVQSLQPLVVGVMAGMVLLWFASPKEKK